jgi:ribosomal protein S21
VSTIVVRRKPGQSQDRLIANFRKQSIADDVVGEARKRARYVSPSEERQERKKELRRKKKARRRARRRTK